MVIRAILRTFNVFVFCSVREHSIWFVVLCCAQRIFNGRTIDIMRLRATNADTYARWRFCWWSMAGMLCSFCSTLAVCFDWRWGLGSLLLMSSSLANGASWDEDDATTSDDEGECRRRTKQRKKDIKIYCRNIFWNNFSLFYKKFRFYVAVVVCWFHFNYIFLFVIFLFTFILRENKNK